MRLFWFIVIGGLSSTLAAAPEQDAQDVYSFGESFVVGGDEENRDSILECQDLTADHARSICSNPQTNLLHKLMERQLSIRMAATALSQQYYLQQEHKRWESETRSFCNTDVTCNRLALQQRLLELHQADTIFRTRLPNPSSGEGLDIAITGRQVEDRYLLHSFLYLKGSDRYGNPKIQQQIDFFRLMRSQHFELLHPKPEPYWLDANFDGWQDLIFLTGERANDISRIYLLYNQEKDVFETNGILNSIDQPAFIQEYQLVSSTWENDQQRGVDYYRYNNGKLTRDARVVYNGIDGSNQWMMTTFSNRTGRMRKIGSVEISANQIGELPSVYSNGQ